MTTSARSSPPFKDYYEAMRLAPGATTDEVDRKFRELLREYSKDTGVGAEARMAELNEAYRVLASRAFRREYDQVWAANRSSPASVLDQPDDSDEVERVPPPPPLAVMSKQHVGARAPRPKEPPPKRRLSIRGWLFKAGILSAYWIIVGPALLANVA
jgi:curved DNA-binding protein CbpA